MTFCVSTGVGTWTNLSTFEPDSDHSPDTGTGLLDVVLDECHGTRIDKSLPYFAARNLATLAVISLL